VRMGPETLERIDTDELLEGAIRNPFLHPTVILLRNKAYCLFLFSFH